MGDEDPGSWSVDVDGDADEEEGGWNSNQMSAVEMSGRLVATIS